MLLLVVLFYSNNFFSQCTGIHFEIHEELDGFYNEYDLTGYTVYRVYADFTSDSNIIHSLTTPTNSDGDEYLGPIEISSTGTIFQHSQGGIIGNQLIEALLTTPGFESLSLDSYITINMETNEDPGQLIFVHSEPVLNEFNENGYLMEQGTLSSVNGSENSMVSNQKALIAQITTNGIPQMCTYVHHAAAANAEFIHSYFCANGEQGCYDAEAANFNPDAGIENNELCLQWGCTDELACNYSTEDLIPNNDVCEYAGCGLLNACNYSAEAECFDNTTCEFAPTYPIEGNIIVNSAPATHQFSYPETPGSTYQWEVSGGTISSGQGSNSIQVIFTDLGSQVVSVQETQLDGCVGNNSVFQVDVSPFVGVPDLSMDEVKIWPNPCTDVLSIQLAQPSGNLKIRDSLGKLVLNRQLNEKELVLDVSTLPTGIYVLHYSGEETNSQLCFMVER